MLFIINNVDFFSCVRRIAKSVPVNNDSSKNERKMNKEKCKSALRANKSGVLWEMLSPLKICDLHLKITNSVLVHNISSRTQKIQRTSIYQSLMYSILFNIVVFHVSNDLIFVHILCWRWANTQWISKKRKKNQITVWKETTVKWQKIYRLQNIIEMSIENKKWQHVISIFWCFKSHWWSSGLFVFFFYTVAFRDAQDLNSEQFQHLFVCFCHVSIKHLTYY